MNDAISTVHVFRATDGTGTVTVTTWHNSRGEAKRRAGASGRVFKGGCLGAWRAVSWSVER